MNIYKRVVALLFLLALSLPAMAQSLRDDHPDEYVVKPGDTLWDIAAQFLNDPWLWPEIWQINDQVTNPHLIFPGDVLRLIYVDGQPRLTLARGVVKLTPEVRTSELDDAITNVPIEGIQEFFTKTRVVEKSELADAPYMVAGPESRIIVGQNDSLYARGEATENISVYEVFREGEDYRDPETDEVLGTRAWAKGVTRLQRVSGEVLTMTVVESYSEISIGDRILPLKQDSVDPQLFPFITETPIDAVIMAVEGGVSQVGALNVVAINRGEEDGVEAGNLLAVMIGGQEIVDRIARDKLFLPDEKAGIMMIFKTYEQMSFGLILEAEKPLAVGLNVTNLLSADAYNERKQSKREAKKGKKRNGVFGFFKRSGS